MKSRSIHPRPNWLMLPGLMLALAACSPPADQAETTWHERPAEVVDEVEPESPGDGRPMLSQFSDDEVSAIREFSDDLRSTMAERELACELLSAEDLADTFGGEWSAGSFRWFESELAIAPAALEDICVWQHLEYRTSVTLRVYSWSELAWASLLDHDGAFARRLYDRPLGDGPNMGRDAYRRPTGEEDYEGTCLALDAHILCLGASPRHAEDWTEDDTTLLERAVKRLDSIDD